MTIIDCHCHVYPEKIVEKAVKGIGDFYDIEMTNDGRINTLLKQGEENGITRHVIFSVATTPKQVASINSFIAQTVSQYPDKFVGLGTLHPDSEDIVADVEQIIKLGLKGVKLHPDFQKFALNDAKCDKMYQACRGRLPILIHAGDKRYEYSNPDNLIPVLEKYPDLTIIAAHLGGYSVWDRVENNLKGYDNLFVDCSSSFAFMSKDRAESLIRFFGADKVLFATDFPMWDIKGELEYFNSLNLTEEERALIFYKNACKLFNID
jgi:predicted TIM-barrel fold metal-dependent hydrolase